MKPVIWLGLAASVGLSLYVTTMSSDEAPTGATASKHGERSRAAASKADSRGPARGVNAADGASSPADQARLALIATAFQAWSERQEAASQWPVLDAARRSAWASQTPPPPPVVAPPPPPPPPPPMAPPFPHAWVGRYVDSAPRAVIEGAMQTWVVKANDVIEGQWRVDAIDERQLRLTYLPLQQSQTVNMKQ